MSRYRLVRLLQETIAVAILFRRKLRKASISIVIQYIEQ